MPPKRKAATKKKEETPPVSDLEVESVSEEEPSSEEESPKPKRRAPPKSKASPVTKTSTANASKKAASSTNKRANASATAASPAKKSKVSAAAAKKLAAAAKKTDAPTAESKLSTRQGGKAENAAVTEKPAPAKASSKKSVPKAPKHIVIEHCKQCQSFKRTATKLEELLKKSIPNLEVTLNPDKPRKGIFEVRELEGDTFVSLQGLVRPFKKMKDLDLEETAADIASKLD